jgi:hypothetical protein
MMSINERAALRRAQAQARAIVDAIAPLRATLERITAGLEPIIKALGKLRLAVERFANLHGSAMGHRLYAIVLTLLESVPGGWRLKRALCAVVYPILYPGLRRLELACAVAACSPPPSRVTSTRRLVSRSTRSLRGPSAALEIPQLEARAA